MTAAPLDVMYAETSPLPPLIPPAHSEGQADVQPPNLWAALGLILLYFLLQAVSSTLILLAIEIAEGFNLKGGAAHIGATALTLLAQPDTQALTAMLTLSVSALVTLRVAHQKWPRLWSLAWPPGFGFTLPVRPQFFVLAVFVGLAAPILGGLLTHLLAHDHDVSQNIQQVGRSASPGLRIPLVLVVTSLGPLVEELLFRGVLLSALIQLPWIHRWRVGWAVVLSSLAFALVHLPGLHWQGYALPQLMLLALALAWLRLRSDSIWPGVLAHGSYNLLAVAAWFAATHLPA
jgi:uncharacterized protein